MSEENTAEVTETTETQTEELGSFYQGLSDEVKADPSAEKFKKANNDEMFKNYSELQSNLGKDKIIMPKADDPDDMRRFYLESGCPGDPSKYDLSTVEDADQINYSAEAFKEFSDHIGLSQAQAEAGQKWYTENQRGLIEQYNKKVEEQFGKDSQAVRKEMGAEYESNVNKVNQVAETFSDSPETAKMIKDLSKGNPKLFSALSKIAGAMSENTIKDFVPNSLSMSKEQAQNEINETLANPKHAYFNDSIAIRQPAIDRMEKLNRIIAGLG